MREIDIAKFVLPDGSKAHVKGRGDWSITKLRSLDTQEDFVFRRLLFDPLLSTTVDQKRYHRLVGVGWNDRYPEPQSEPKLHDVWVDESRCEELDLERPSFSDN